MLYQICFLNPYYVITYLIPNQHPKPVSKGNVYAFPKTTFGATKNRVRECKKGEHTEGDDDFAAFVKNNRSLSIFACNILHTHINTALNIHITIISIKLAF